MTMISVQAESTALSFIMLLFTAIQGFNNEKDRVGTFIVLKGAVLKNHMISKHNAHDSMECAMYCASVSNCQSFNYKQGSTCQLNSKNMMNANESDIEADADFSLFNRDPCIPNLCVSDKTTGQCVAVNSSDGYQCGCKRGYKGTQCEIEKLGWFIHKPALSCKEILDKEGPGPDGEYYIDPGSGVTLPVFCDMTHEGGGWLLTMNLTYQTGRNGFTIYPTYSGISKFRDGYMGISSPALGELHSLINFTQLRFHCQKKLTRTLHIITTQDDKGTAVIDYFTAKTANLPTSCGSFTRGADDNSMLAIGCGQWGAGKWGHENRKTEALRMYDYAMYIPLKYHWIANGGYCDDTSSSSSDGDFWFIYVR